MTDSQTLYGSSSQPISTSRAAHAPRLRRPRPAASPAPSASAPAPVADDLQIQAGDLAREVAHAGDVRGAVGDADHAARVEHVEGVAALEHVVVGRDRQARLEAAQRLGLVLAEVPVQHLGVGDLEVVAAELALVLLVHVAVGDDVLRAVLVPARPDEVVDAVHALQVHGEALEAVGDLDGDGVEVEAAELLEVRELGGLHAVDPDLPALAPGAERGALPVVLDEAHVVLGEVDAEGLERAQVHVLDVGRRRLDDHLVLVVVAEAVGVLAVAAVGGAHGRLDVGGAPGTGVEAAQERGGVEGAGADLGVVRLHDDAALPLPEGLQAADDLLERGVVTGEAAAVWAWSVTGPFGRKRDSTSSSPEANNRATRRLRTRRPDGCSSGAVARRWVHSGVAGLRESRGRSGRRDGDASDLRQRVDSDASADPPGVRRPCSLNRGRRLRMRGPRPRARDPARLCTSRRAMRSARSREPVWYAYSWCTSRSASPAAAEAGCSRSSASGSATASSSAATASGVIGTASPTQSPQTSPPRAAEKPRARPPDPQAAQCSSTGR